MTATEPLDLVVIGGGAAGEKGAARAAYFGKRVAVVERRDEPGGATVHTGTLPSKTLREAALFLSGFRQRDLYGVSVQVERHLEVAKLIERKDAVRELETGRMLENLARHKVELVHGSARLVDATTVEVTGNRGERRRFTAETLLIVTGSNPFRPPGIPFDDPDVHDSDSILEIDHLPASLAVLGGGVIGCEYASMFAVLGTDVHLVERRDPLLPFLDAEIVERMTAGMRDLGVTFHLGERADAVARREGALVSTLPSGGEVRTEKVLVTAGRTGNTAELGLEQIGVETDDRGRILVDEAFRTSVPSVFAAGDVTGAPALAASSMEQARVAVSQAFGFGHDRYEASMLPYGVYTIPEVSSVGLSEQDASARGIDVVAGRALFRDNARGAIIGDRDGMTKLVFDRATRRLIGCHCVGERACELVHVGQAVMQLDGTVETLIDMVFNYPSLSETYKYAAYDALARLGEDGAS
ncbi:MAG: Si-specific NAD(P)(+) transhydrogenase [Actinobacteria bacterium]|nr:MAG: Si-specific NAD(P)(+) transhydrogenase [Actinomycetota bacterium]